MELSVKVFGSIPKPEKINNFPHKVCSSSFTQLLLSWVSMWHLMVNLEQDRRGEQSSLGTQVYATKARGRAGHGAGQEQVRSGSCSPGACAVPDTSAPDLRRP